MRTAVAFCLAVLGLLSFAQAQKHPFTFEDMMALKRVEEPEVSPDGKWVLFAAVDVGPKASGTFSRPSSRMSLETVACVTRQPAAASAPRSSSCVPSRCLSTRLRTSRCRGPQNARPWRYGVAC